MARLHPVTSGIKVNSLLSQPAQAIMSNLESDRTLLKTMFSTAVDSALPARSLAACLPDPPDSGRILVLGAGKAAGAMAAALEDSWSDCLDRMDGLVVTRYKHATPTRKVRVVEAAHPVPDAAGSKAAADILALAEGAGPGDTVIGLISGGASSLLALPVDGVTLDEKQELTRDLLRSGADITEMNCLRKHLSRIKGGRLAAAVAPARLITIAISDVVGNDPSVIGSGPTAADSTTLADARAIVTKYQLKPAPSIAAALANQNNETPGPEHTLFKNADFRMMSGPENALLAAAEIAEQAGLNVINLGADLTGNAREVACEHANLARRHQMAGNSVCLLSGGELTVRLVKNGKGHGGPNREYALSLALALGGMPNCAAIACDTDGADGSNDVAGAIIDPTTWHRFRKNGINPGAHLVAGDSGGAFAALGDQIITGPTFTNVNDFRAIIIRPL